MDRSQASERVRFVRELLESSEIDPSVHSDGTIFLIGNEGTVRFTGQQAFDGLVEVLDVFELTEPVEGVSRGELWGPSLVRPSTHTYISPWVLAGEPCVEGSRVPSATLYALRENRGLGAPAIHELYTGLSVEAIEDAPLPLPSAVLPGLYTGLSVEAIEDAPFPLPSAVLPGFYTGLSAEAIEDALAFETRLRAA